MSAFFKPGARYFRMNRISSGHDMVNRAIEFEP
jgi:hypothetical protein